MSDIENVVKPEIDEHELNTHLVDCPIKEFVGLIRSVDSQTQIGMLGVLRADYQQMELALKDLRERINKKNSFTQEEGKLHIELASKMVLIEEKCRILVDETGRSTEDEFVEGTFISVVPDNV